MPAKTLDDLLTELESRESRADQGGGPARVARQKKLGRGTARERIGALIDSGSFVELGRHALHRNPGSDGPLGAHRHPGDGIVAGLARIDGRPVAVWTHDPTVLRGAVGLAGARKVCRLMDLALERGLPIVTIADSDGARVEEGLDAIEGNGELMRRIIRMKGRIPQITLVAGLCAGAAAYAAALTDWVAMVEGQSYLFITGAKITKVVTGEDVSIDDLGGPAMHVTRTGQCHSIVATEAEGVLWVKRLLGYLSRDTPRTDPVDRGVPELEALVPVAERRGYDMHKVVAALFDRGSLLELSPLFAKNLLTYVARLGGRTVAVVASQPMVLGGCLDIDSSRKGAHFVSWASERQIPIVTLVDVPGYLPGSKQEQGGALAHGATLLAAYGNARVPLVCLVLRKSYGGATVLSFAADIRLALPTARIAPVGAEAALEIALGHEPPDAREDVRATHAAKREAWLAEHDHAWAPAEAGYVDQVVRPRDARRALAAAVRSLERDPRVNTLGP
jgi:propionyl-CoA carboxylase beta chain